MRAACCLVVVLILAWLSPAANAQAQLPTSASLPVRVRLFDREAPTVIALSAHGGSLRLHAGEHAQPLLELDEGQDALASLANGELYVRVHGLDVSAQSLRVEPVGEALFGIEVREGVRTASRRRYTGTLRVAPEDDASMLRLVNVVPLDRYTASIVATEYGLDDFEGSKAMAVLARTYLLRMADTGHPEYDLVDHELSQAYHGEDAVTPLSREATRLTRGEVLTYEGRPIQAVYHSSSGGHTANNEAVWSGPPVPYLRGKRDPYDAASPHTEWTSRIPRSELLAELERTYDRRVNGFLIDQRSRDRRVATVALLMPNGSRHVISGNEFRLLVNKRFGVRKLRSMLFDVRRSGNEYLFEGRGYGHGVGLSQWGAHGMARRGTSYADILSFYYTGTVLSRPEGAVSSRSGSVGAQDVPALTSQPTAKPGAADAPPIVRTAQEEQQTGRPRRRIGW